MHALAADWFQRQAARNAAEDEAREDAATPPARRLLTPFRKLSHLSDDAAAKVVAKELERPQWTAAEWRYVYEERAAIFEYDQGLSREEAEHRAYLHCLRQWLTRNPPGYRPDLKCLQCGDITSKSDLPVVCPDTLQRWLHQACATPYRQLRVRDAILGLEILGLFHVSSPKE